MNKYTKKVLLTLAFTAFAANTVSAAVNVRVNGIDVNFASAQPVIENGRTLIPLRGVFEKLGYTVNWIADTKTAVISKGETQISVAASSPILRVNGTEKTLDVSAEIIDGSMYIPLRAIGEAGGLQVSWDADTKTADINSAYVNTNNEDSIYQYVSQKSAILRNIDFVGFEKTLFSDSSNGITDSASAAQDMLSSLNTAYDKLSTLSVPNGYEQDYSKTLNAVGKLREICTTVIEISNNGNYEGLNDLVQEIVNLNNSF